ncbi:MAG: hypothetical protein ACI828_000378 [Flavobacteriales bacterium]
MKEIGSKNFKKQPFNYKKMNYLKSILTALIVLTILSCKSNETNKDQLLNNNWEKKIALDGSNKWMANEETTLGVNKMLDLLENLDTSSEIDYTALGTDLKNEINIVIQKCSMKGPSHDNLHVFLMPLIEKVDALQASRSIEDNKLLVDSIIYNLKAYNTYFV